MAIETIQTVTCDDTGKSYRVLEGHNNHIPQIWEIELSFRLLKLPGCFVSGSPILTRKLLVERQLLVDAGLVSQTSQEKPKPLGSSTNDILLDLLRSVGVVPHQEDHDAV